MTTSSGASGPDLSELADLKARVAAAIREGKARGEDTVEIPYSVWVSLPDGTRERQIRTRRIPNVSTTDELRDWVQRDLIDSEGNRHQQAHIYDDGTVVYDDEAVVAMNEAWKAGRFPGLRRDVGHGAETLSMWRRRTSIQPAVAGGGRSRERRPRSRQRTGSSSRASSSGDDEPPAEPRRFCAGCGCDISHRRAGARTCGPKCRTRKHRGTGRDERLLDARDERWDEAAREGGRRDLTYNIEHQLGELYATPLPEKARARIAERTEMDALDAIRWEMEHNGVTVAMRHRGSPWTQVNHALRTRPTVVA